MIPLVREIVPATVTTQYLVLIAITLTFSVLSFVYSDRLVLAFLAGLTWFVSGIVHFIIGDPSTVLTWSLGFLYVGFGIMFMIKTVYGASKTMYDKRWSLEL